MVNFSVQIILVYLIIVLSIPLLTFGQNSQSNKDNIILLHPESPSDPYLPNDHNNRKVSHAYRYKNSTTLLQTASTIYTSQVNIDANGMNILNDAANEPSIAINPLNPNEIAIGWRQFDNISSNFRQAGVGYTIDGGQTWTFPGVIEPGIFRSDPVLNYDNSGNFYYNSLTVDTANNYTCDVFKSTDGGMTWPLKVFANGGDKQWMAIDRTTGIGAGNIYAYWTYAFSSCPPDFFTRSTNGGLSYEACTAIPGDPFWGKLAIGNAGELYIGAATPNYYDLMFSKSLNAQTPGSAISWSLPVLVFMDGSASYGPTVNPSGLLGQVSIDVDRSNGVGQDNVYMLASVNRFFTYDPGDVMFAKSIDGGNTWSYPVQVNDDPSVDNTQWLSTMSVAPNGRIDVVWLDTRDAPFGSDSSALYYSFSTDEGNTWSVNEKLSNLFDPHVGYPNQDKMGDYFDMISDNTGAHLAWANTLNGGQDVYYSYIIPPLPTGLNEIDKDPIISVYPNPGSSFFTINLNKSYEKINVAVYSSIGKIIKSIEFQNATQYTLNLTGFYNGIYLLKTTLNDQQTSNKIIIKTNE